MCTLYEVLKEEIVNAMKYMEDRGLNYGRSGNVSIRVKGTEYVLITPSGLPKASLTPSDVLVVTINGDVVEGVHRPTVEMPLHTTIYRRYDYVNSVIHAHGIYTTALAVAREPLPPIVEEMVIYVGGDVRVAEYAPFGSEELAERVAEALRERMAALLANHGVVACGKSLQEALEVLTLVERVAQVYLLSKLAGKITTLPEESVELQRKLFIERLKI
ncbi:MAG: class II aldolase/adducin family protein [Zestosphaera sp.]